MSRYYGMHVEIKGYASGKSNAIQGAANEGWSSFAGDWDEQNNALAAYGEASLYGGESEDDFTARLTHAIWRANGAFCEVIVIATYLEDPPHEIHTLSPEDYESFIAPAHTAPSPS